MEQPPRVMRAHLELRVFYDAPAFGCGRVLRVLPQRRADWTIIAEHVDAAPAPDQTSEDEDAWNNRRWRLFHRRIERELKIVLEVEAQPRAEPLPAPQPSGLLKLPSRAVPFVAELAEVVREARTRPAFERASELNRFVFESLTYTNQTSGSPLDAHRIWEEGRGSCADFAHVLLALCRASGLFARYVAGFGPAPGALHAWVEVACDGVWRGFDPTHGREAHGLYLPVATGRDFYDCAPHRGRSRGGSARLELFCELR